MTGLNESIQTYSTAIAALFAAVSAGIAVWAMKKNGESSRSLLAETQRTNARQGFEQRYTLLLAQHNALHDSLCEHLNTEPTIRNTHDVANPLSAYNNELSGLERYFYFLTGHPVISPYMRVLFHILKHINDDPYMLDKTDAEKRLYSSPLRSYIRNDVLFLIAVNALNVNSDHPKVAGYPMYQKLLHRFNFFEHAVFTNPRHPNEPFMMSLGGKNNTEAEREHFRLALGQNWGYMVSGFIGTVRKGQLIRTQSLAYEVNTGIDERIMFPHDLLSTPLLACTAVYSNPHSDGLLLAISDYAEEVFDKCKLEYKWAKERYVKAQAVLRFINGSYIDLRGEQYPISTIADLESLYKSTPVLQWTEILVKASGEAQDESVRLYDIRDEISTFTELESVTWPQDESHYHVLLKKRIHQVCEEAYRSLVSSLRYQFDK